MALRRETFHRARVAEFWRGTVSDDFQISRAVREAGLGIAYAPGALTADVSHTTARELFSWITRQMIITRVYHPRLWRLALVSHLVYCAAMTLSVVYFPPALAVQLSLGMIKGRNRARLAALELKIENRWIHTVLVPLATWLWLYGLLASSLTETVSWRGRRYRPGRGLL